MFFSNNVYDFRGEKSELIKKTPKDYGSCDKKLPLPLQMNIFNKLIKFYFRIPAIKFVTSVVSLL